MASINFNCVHTNLSNKHLVHYLVLIESEQLDASTGDIQELLVRFWERQLLNVLIIFHRLGNVSVASYNPFAANRYTYFVGNETTPERLLFPDKTANLNGYELRATVFQDLTRVTFNESNLRDAAALDGADGCLAQLILRYMNASVRLMYPRDHEEIGQFLKNGSATGCLGHLVRREVDFGINGRLYRLQQFKNVLEATITNGRDDICILVPRAGKATDIGNIFRAFTACDWAAIAASLPAFTFTYRLVDAALSRHNNRPRKTIATIFFELLAMNLGQSSHVFPGNWLKKCLMGFWLIYALLITSLYQSMLSGNLIIPKDLPDINSIGQLDRSNFKLLSYSRYHKQILEFLRDTQNNATYRRLPDRLVNVEPHELENELRRHNRTVAYANKHHINVYWRRIHRINGEVIYNEMKQCPVPYVTVYGLMYGTPYKGRINYIIRQAQEGGLIEKWSRIDKIKEKLSQSKLRSERDHEAFTMMHLRTAFFIFGIGCLTGGAVFLMEMSPDFRRWFCHKLHFGENVQRH